MYRDLDHRRRLSRWLNRLGFSDDPFALYEADQERAYLPYLFVDRPYVHEILGNPAHPQVAFLFAGRGGGKTATREMVAYQCRFAELRRQALAVRYYDFSLLAEQVNGDLSRLTLRHHARAIVRATLQAIVEEVPATFFEFLEPFDRTLLMSYAAHFGDSVARLKFRQILHDEPAAIDWTELTPREILEMLANLVTQLGRSKEVRYQALYILVDRVDETAAGVDGAMALLKPLASESSFLETPHAAFKFFLQLEVGEQLQQAVTLRPDRMCIRTIVWDATALTGLIQQRLKYFSNGRVSRLEELCASGAKAQIMERLIQVCDHSPRTLIRLCHDLIHYHVDRTDDALLDRSDITDTISDFVHQLETEAAPRSPTPLVHSALASPAVVPKQGLFLNEHGHVYVDGQLLSPPLSEHEFRLLQALYRYAPEIVPNQTLLETLWPEWGQKDDDPPVDDQNLRKLVTRLRKRLPGELGRYVRNVRGRGYWLETAP